MNIDGKQPQKYVEQNRNIARMLLDKALSWTERKTMAKAEKFRIRVSELIIVLT